MNSLLARPIRLFVISFIIVWAVTVAVGLSLLAMDQKPERSGAIGSYLQGTLGAAIALAGSVVAIVIANNANNTILLQTKRETSDLVNTRFETSVNAVNEVAQALSNAFTAWAICDPVRERILVRLTELDGWQEYAQNGDPLLSAEEVEAKLQKGIAVSAIQGLLPIDDQDLTTWKESMSSLADAIDKLAAALEAICENSYSLLLWQKQDVNPTSLSFISAVPGLSRLSVATSPLEVASLLRTCAKRISGPLTVRSISEPRLSASLGSRNLRGEGLHNLLEMGAAIFRMSLPKPERSRDEEQDEDDNVGIGFVNIGVCFLVDLVQQLPTQETCRRTAEELFDGLLTDDEMQKLPIMRIMRRFSPRTWVNADFLSAVRSYVQCGCTPVVRYSELGSD